MTASADPKSRHHLPLSRPGLTGVAVRTNADDEGPSRALEQAVQLFANPPRTLLEGADPRLPENLKERLPQAQAHAQQALTVAEQQGRQQRKRHQAQFAALQRALRNPVHALEALRDLADEFVRPIAKVSACRPGCAHCCHIPVALSAPEAELVGREIGLKPLEQEPGHARAWETWGYDQPCPFLREKRCAIHTSRPMACRWHFNLDTDPLLCELLPDMTVPVPLADMRSFQVLYSRFSQGTPLADIRDFFPAERVARWKPPGAK